MSEWIITYCTEPERVLSAVIIDSRGQIPVLSKANGFALKAYIDGQLSLIIPGVLPFKIEAMDGNLAAIFTLQVKEVETTLYQRFIRSNFKQFEQEILAKISNFITAGNWKYYII